VEPPERDGATASREEYPLSVVSFVRLIFYLKRSLGYPSHWFVNLVRHLLSGRVKTRGERLTASPLSWPPSRPGAMHVVSTLLGVKDLRAVVSCARLATGIGFLDADGSALPSPRDVLMMTVRCSHIAFNQMALASCVGVLLHPRDISVPPSVRDILQRKNLNGHGCFLLSVVEWNPLTRSEITFFLCKDDFEQLHTRHYMVCVVRTDMWTMQTLSRPLSACTRHASD
jgi:hypothetical protein